MRIVRSPLAFGTRVLVDTIAPIDHQKPERLLLIAYYPTPGIKPNSDRTRLVLEMNRLTVGVAYINN